MSTRNHYLTGEFSLRDSDLRCVVIVIVAYAIMPDGPKPLDLNVLRIVHTSYEMPADDGYDPEPLVFDCRYTLQQIEFEKRLMVEFENEILEAVTQHASTGAAP